jgi:hypothetical protein
MANTNLGIVLAKKRMQGDGYKIAGDVIRMPLTGILAGEGIVQHL